MHNSVYQTLLSADQEVSYLSAYIDHYRQHYRYSAHIALYSNIAPCDHRIEHDILLPLINDVFRFGILQVDDPVIVFDLQLDRYCFTFGLYYKLNRAVYDERLQVTLIKLRVKLEKQYPDMHIIHRDQRNGTHLVFIKILF